MGLPKGWLRLALWVLPWLVTAGLAIGLATAGDEPPPASRLILEPELEGHEVLQQGVIEGVGDVGHLPPEIQRAFRYTSHFAPMPEPGPDDWLSIHPERGQTVLDFVQSRPNRPEPPRDRIYILPIGELPRERGPTVDELADYARRYFGLHVHVMPTVTIESLDVPARTHEGIEQRNAAAILDRLQEQLPRDAYCLVAVTFEDLYPSDDFNYVFGLARLHTRVGVFSFARYHPEFFGETFDVDRRVVLRRAFKVMSHEIGHMFGLEHCTHLHCNMNGANHLAELDRSPMHLCPVCLRKLHTALDFSPADRYGRLAGFYSRLGLDAEADWAEQRRAYLERGDDG